MKNFGKIVNKTIEETSMTTESSIDICWGF